MTEIKRFFQDQLMERMDQELGFIQVLIGPRQVGKTTAVGQLLQTWNGSVVSVSADEVAAPTGDWISFHWQRAIEKDHPRLLVIDEIQKVDGWARTIKVLFDRDRKSKKLRVLLTGSASLQLQKGLEDSLAGRFELIRSPHWTLPETKEAFGWDLITFLKFGGYPAPAGLIDDTLRWQSHMRDSIIESVLGRDLQLLVNVQKPALLRQLFELCMRLPAQEISYQKLLGQLQDKGNAATIKSYIEILEGAFLIRKLEKFSPRAIAQKSSSPKLIPCSPALIHAFSSPSLFDEDLEWRGRVFEAVIGAHLNILYPDLYYWRSGKEEVDYVVRNQRQEIIAIEVKSGRRKSEKGLQAFKKMFPDARTEIISYERSQDFLSTLPGEK